MARLEVLLEQTKVSLDVAHACVQRLAALPRGPVNQRLPKVLKVPEGESYFATENPLGFNGYYLASLAPGPLLAALHAVEGRHGRVRDIRWGARTLDLDLVQYGTPGSSSEVLGDEPELRLPHPRAHERAFVLRPWHAVDPAAVLRVPGTAVGQGDQAPASFAGGPVRRVSDVLADLDEAGVRVGPAWDPLR